jgi:hypothetical protein
MNRIKVPYTTPHDIPLEYSAWDAGASLSVRSAVCDFAVCRAREFEDEVAFWAMRSDPTSVDSQRDSGARLD